MLSGTVYFVLAIFDLNNDEKRQPDLEKASWLATIKVSWLGDEY